MIVHGNVYVCAETRVCLCRDTVLVTGASGALGLAAVDLITRVYGAKVKYTRQCICYMEYICSVCSILNVF